MKIAKLKDSFQRMSLGEFTYYCTYEAMNKVVLFKVLQGMTLSLEDIDQRILDEGAKYESRFLTAAECRGLAEQDEYPISGEFVRKALAKGDECFAIFVDGKLASYGWYSDKPTRLTQALNLHFDNRYQYMYAGYTLPAYRGMRLHAIGMALAAKAYTERQFKGLISYVEAHNVASLRSCYRLGYKDFGRVTVLGVLNRHFVSRSKRCRDYAFDVQPAPAAVPEAAAGAA